MSLSLHARAGATRHPGVPRPLRWSGYDWKVRATTSSMGPGPNHWSDTPLAAEVGTDGSLRLGIFFSGGAWQCVEVVGPHLGYGKYEWVVATDPTNWDIKPVLGLFTYDDSDDGSHAYRELDIEFSLWNYAAEKSRCWYSVQPVTGFENRMEDHGVTNATPYTCTMIWQAGQVYFKTLDANGKLLGEHVCKDNVQVPGSETIRANLWLQNGLPPQNGQPVTARLNSFTFTPSVTHSLVSAANTTITFTDGTPGSLTLKAGATITSNKLQLACAAGDYSVAFTGSVFDLTSSSIDTHVVQVPATGNGTTEALFEVRYDADNYLTMFVSGGGFYARLRQASVNTTSALPAYNATTHAYWRIREAAGTVYFDTSSDRASWTNRYSHAHTLDTKIQTMRVRYECGYYGTETSPLPLIIGAINAA
jgi:hypothetical protein